MLTFFVFLVEAICSTNYFKCHPNKIQVQDSRSFDQIKAESKPIFIKLEKNNYFKLQEIETQWAKAAELFPQANFITVDCSKNIDICSLHSEDISEPQYGFVLPGKNIDKSEIKLISLPNDTSSSNIFVDIVQQYANLYPVTNDIDYLTSSSFNSFYQNINEPKIIIFYNSCSSKQYSFLNSWIKLANQNFLHNEKIKIGLLDNSLYPTILSQFNHDSKIATPCAIIFSKSGKLEKIINQEDITKNKIINLLDKIKSDNLQTINTKEDITGSCGPDVTFEIQTTTKNLIISGNGPMEDRISSSPFSQYSNNIQSVVINDGVTTIGDYSFYSLKYVTVFNISETVTKIGQFAFYGCNSLTSITLPDNIETIGDKAFYTCYQLKTIEFPANLKTIGNSAFNSLEKINRIDLPDSLISIGDQAFLRCTLLTHLIIPKNVVSIGIESFSGCGCRNITIPKSLVSLGKDAFKSCKNVQKYIVDAENEHFISIDGVLYFKNLTRIVYFPCASQEITNYIIPNGVTTLGTDDLSNAENIETITFPESLTSIQTYIASSCKKLKAFYVSENNPVYASYDGFLYSKDYTTIIKAPQVLSSPCYNNFHPSTTTIGYYSFYNNRDLVSIDIPDTITSLEDFAFSSCEILRSVILPNNINEISQGLFYYCKKLVYVHIPNTVVTIKDKAFRQCESLRSITIPASVNEIVDGPFLDCYYLDMILYLGSRSPTHKSSSNICSYCSLTNVTVTSYYSDTQFCGYDVVKLTEFSGNYGNISWNFELSENKLTISNCETCTSKATGARPWSRFLSEIFIVEIEDGFISIDDNLFDNCTALKTIIMPKNIEHIGKFAFRNCINLKNFPFDESIKTIDEKAFYNNGFTSICFNDELTKIGEYAFDNCMLLTNVTFGKNILSFGSRAFYDCINIKYITLSQGSVSVFRDYFSSKIIENIFFDDSVTKITSHAFSSCYYIKNVTLPDGLITIENGAFYDCYDLLSLTIPDSVTSIGNSVFYECYKLSSIKLSKNLISIGKNAFQRCNKLSTINFPNSLTNIGEYAFESCWSIESVTFPNSIINISNYIFRHCRSLSTVNLHNKIEAIGSYSFSNCSNLVKITIPESVYYIGIGCFQYCFLSEIKYYGQNPPDFGKDVFSNSNSLTIYVPENYTSDTFCGLPVTKSLTPGGDTETSPDKTPEIEETESLSDKIPEIEGTESSSEIIKPDTSSEIDDTITSPPFTSSVPIPTHTSEPELIIKLNVSENINKEQLDKELNDAFEQLGKDENTNNVVIIDIDKIPFNSTLEKNNFIKPKDDSTIDFIGGKLNIVMPDNGKVTISLNDEEETSLSVKGEGNLEIASSQTNKKQAINIVGNSQINGSFSIIVPEYVESVTMDSISIESNSSISLKRKGNNVDNKAVQFKVKNLTAVYNTNASIYDVIIENKLKTVQTSKLYLDNVVFNNAVVELEIFDFDKNNNWKDPFLNGNFNNPPQSFILTKASTNKDLLPEVDVEYTLMSGDFEVNKCKEWLDKIQLDGTGFNSKNCESNPLLANYENKRIVMKATSDSDGGKNGKLTTAQIAGIAIGCVAGVAIIAVVIIIIVRKVKKRQESSNEKDLFDDKDPL